MPLLTLFVQYLQLFQRLQSVYFAYSDYINKKINPHLKPNPMQKRPRIKSPIFTAKADGTIIRRGEVKISTHSRIKQLVRQLGGEQVLRDIRWENLCKKASLL